MNLRSSSFSPFLTGKRSNRGKGVKVKMFFSFFVKLMITFTQKEILLRIVTSQMKMRRLLLRRAQYMVFLGCAHLLFNNQRVQTGGCKGLERGYMCPGDKLSIFRVSSKALALFTEAMVTE